MLGLGGTSTYQCWRYITYGLLKTPVSIKCGYFESNSPFVFLGQNRQSQFSTFRRFTTPLDNLAYKINGYH